MIAAGTKVRNVSQATVADRAGGRSHVYTRYLGRERCETPWLSFEMLRALLSAQYQSVIGNSRTHHTRSTVPIVFALGRLPHLQVDTMCCDTDALYRRTALFPGCDMKQHAIWHHSQCGIRCKTIRFYNAFRPPMQVLYIMSGARQKPSDCFTPYKYTLVHFPALQLICPILTTSMVLQPSTLVRILGRFLPACLLDRPPQRRPPTVKLMNGILSATLNLKADGDGLIAAEAFPHVDHAALALPVALFQLLAPSRQGVDERGAQAVRRFVALDQHAVRLLQAERQCRS